MLSFTFCDLDRNLKGMGKLIIFIILGAMLLGYGKYVTNLQTEAMNRLNTIQNIYANAEVTAQGIH